MILVEVIEGKIWQSDREGAEAVACGTGRLEELGIGGVICAAHNLRLKYREELPVLILPVDDHGLVDGDQNRSPVSPKLFDTAVDFHRRHGPTLVHCDANGVRSSAFAAALAMFEGHSVESAIAATKGVPTPELLEALEVWAATHPEGW